MLGRFILVTALLFAPVISKAEGLPDFTDLVEKQSASVVNISTTQAPKAGEQNEDAMQDFFKHYGIPVPPGGMPGMPRGNGGGNGDGRGGNGGGEDQHSLGSGFIISADGYVLTNAHVVQNADEITVSLTDKRKLIAKVIGSDRKTDVALIKIEATGLQPVKMGDAEKLKVGEWVIAIGSPFGFESTVTKGIVSAKGRSLPQETLVPFIQTDVPINPGNSGGPLFNMKGEVVGINSQIYSRTGGFMGLSFAIPIDVALDVSKQLRDTGHVTRGWLGVVIQDVTQDIADSFGLSSPQGALIANVEKGGPGDKGGLLPSDIITQFDGKTIRSREDLPRVVGATKPGHDVPVTVWRKGKSTQLHFAVGEMPSEVPNAMRPASRRQGADTPSTKIGLSVNNLKDDQRKELDIKGGILIEDANGAAAKAGLQSGDVILSINNVDISSVEQFNRTLGEVGGKKAIALLVRRGDSSRFITLKKDAG
jgi:serine protease Do